MATSSLRKWGEEQAALGPVKAGSYVGRAGPWWVDGRSWGEIMVRRGQYAAEGADGALQDLSDEITQFTLDQPDPLSLPPLRLHIDLLMPVSNMLLCGQASWSDSVQQIFTKCLPCSWCCAGCSEAKGGPICQESLASLCNLWVSLALWSSTSSSV